jgi:hypothetical protein
LANRVIIALCVLAFFFGWTVGFEQILLQENGDLFVRSNPGSGF